MNGLAERVRDWHRPMLWFAAASAVMGVVAIGGTVWDDRILLGAPIWMKLVKFALSFAVYGVTWAWMISLLPRARRLAGRLSTVLVAMLTIEYLVMLVQVLRGRPSHFNVATPLDTALWATMAASIGVLWVATLVLTVILFAAPIADAAQRWAIRLGSSIALVGLALGFLMTSPTAQQLAARRAGAPPDMVGAHTVGLPDGGPGMPVTGWSTVGGDLRIPHFVGMHALQVLPLLVIGLGLLAGRWPRLRDVAVRTRLVLVGACGYAGLLALVTWQALRGQSLIHPDGLTLGAAGALLVGVLAGTAVSFARRRPDVSASEAVGRVRAVV